MIQKLDKKQRFVVGIVGAVALLAGFYMLYYDPSQKKIAEIRRDIEARDNEIRNAKIQAVSFKLLKKQVAELEEQLGELRAKIATSGEIISLVKTIEEEAKRLDLKVVNMYSTVYEAPPQSPTEEHNKESKTKELSEEPEDPTHSFTKTILKISLQGKYDKLEGFMKSIQHLETFLVVEGLDLNGTEEMYPRLSSNMKINLYNEKGVGNNATIK